MFVVSYLHYQKITLKCNDSLARFICKYTYSLSIPRLGLGDLGDFMFYTCKGYRYGELSPRTAEKRVLGYPIARNVLLAYFLEFPDASVLSNFFFLILYFLRAKNPNPPAKSKSKSQGKIQGKTQGQNPKLEPFFSILSDSKPPKFPKF